MDEILQSITEDFTLPFPPHKFQLEGVDELSARDCSLLMYKVGLGKTFTSILSALYASQVDGVEQIVVLCPPILIDQWAEFLATIEGIPEVGVYRGDIVDRKKMDMQESVIIMSYNIFRAPKTRKVKQPDGKFKRVKTALYDFDKLKKIGKASRLCVIADELSLKSLSSNTYKKVRELLYRKARLKVGDKPYHKLIALNATPLSDLSQVYNWCTLFAPGTYGSKRLFLSQHAEKQDNWGKVEEWKNEDDMRTNMGMFAVNTTTTVKIPPLIDTVVPYTLSKAHKKLYDEVKQMELDNLPEEKIELALNSMFSTLQRLVILPREFGLDIDSPVLEFINGYIDQMDPDDGLLVYTRHVAVSEMLAKEIPDCGAIYGGIKKDERAKVFAGLKSGELKRTVGNLDSLGKGLNLQMLNHMIYVEFPFKDDVLTQSLGRQHRQGQQKTCFSSFPLAKGTLQRQIYSRLLKNGEEINTVMRTKDDVRKFLS